MVFQVLFFEANHIFNDRLVKYEDKKKFEEIIHRIYADHQMNFKYEGFIYKFIKIKYMEIPNNYLPTIFYF